MMMEGASGGYDYDRVSCRFSQDTSEWQYDSNEVYHGHTETE